VDVSVTSGTAGLDIVRLAVEQNADVVVIGAPRRWASTTHTVLAHSPCPVLVAHDAQPLPWPPAQTLNHSRVSMGMNSSRS
jgi:nucleotide-binding universal stress UspA family protein